MNINFIEVTGTYDRLTMNGVKLVTPSKEHEERAFEFLKEFSEYNSETNGVGGLDRYNNYDEWLMKLERDLDIKNIPEGRVPANTYFLLRESDNEILGAVNLRHKLNGINLIAGGHIGYSIRPRERNNGYGTLILKLALERCKELKLTSVLVTCNKSNIASAKVIQNNGGILENEVFNEAFGGMIQRYWIDL